MSAGRYMTCGVRCMNIIVPNNIELLLSIKQGGYMKKNKYSFSDMIFKLIVLLIIVSIFYDYQNRILYYSSLILLGLFCSINGIYVFMQRNKFIKKSNQLDGVIIELVEEVIKGASISGVSITYHPLVEYIDKADGTKRHFMSRNGYLRFMLKKGQAVKLRYYADGTNQDILIDKWLDIWGFPVFSLLFGAINLLIGFIKILY
jgi:hypothetical protein